MKNCSVYDLRKYYFTNRIVKIPVCHRKHWWIRVRVLLHLIQGYWVEVKVRISENDVCGGYLINDAR